MILNIFSCFTTGVSNDGSSCRPSVCPVYRKPKHPHNLCFRLFAQVINTALFTEQARTVLQGIEGVPSLPPAPRRLMLSEDVTEMVEAKDEDGSIHFAATRDIVVHIFSDCVVLARLGVLYAACGQLRRRRQIFFAHIPLKELLATEMEPTLDEHGCALLLVQLRWDHTRVLLRSPAEHVRRNLLDILSAAMDRDGGRLT